MDVEKVSAAVQQGKSIRAAAKLLGKSYTSLQFWLATNGYAVKVERRARLVKKRRSAGCK